MKKIIRALVGLASLAFAQAADAQGLNEYRLPTQSVSLSAMKNTNPNDDFRLISIDQKLTTTTALNDAPRYKGVGAGIGFSLKDDGNPPRADIVVAGRPASYRLASLAR